MDILFLAIIMYLGTVEVYTECISELLNYYLKNAAKIPYRQ